MPKDRTANSGSPEKSRWYDSIDYHLAWARMPALLRRIRPTGILSAFQCELRADKVQEAVRQLPRPLSDESHQALLRSRYPAFFDCASKVTVQICHSLSSRVLPSTQELVSTALNPGLLLIFDRESDELVVDSAGLHYLNQIAERDGAKFQHWLTRMRSSKGSQLAAVLEREIQCWLAEEVCSAFPFEQHVGRIDSQLGLTLRRCEEEGSEPLVSYLVPDVLLKRGAFRARVKSHLTDLLENCSVSSLAQLSQRVRNVQSLLTQRLGLTTPLMISLGTGLPNPIRFTPASSECVIDVSVLELEEEQCTALLGFGLAHMQRRSIFCTDAAYCRELTSYFEAAADLMTQGAKSRTMLRSAFENLVHRNWACDLHLSYLAGIEAAVIAARHSVRNRPRGKGTRQIEVRDSGLRPTTLSEWSKLKSLLLDACELDQLAALGPGGSHSRRRDGTAWNSSFVLPRHSDAMLLADATGFSFDTARDLLSENRFLLRGLRSTDQRAAVRRRLSALARFMPPDAVQSDLSLGRESVVCLIATGEGTNIPSSVEVRYRRACFGYQLFELLIGRDRLQQILWPLDQSERESLIIETPAGRFPGMTLREVASRYFQATRWSAQGDARSASRQGDSVGTDAVSSILDGSCGDGVSLLKAGKHPSLLVNLVRNMGLGSIYQPSGRVSSSVEAARRELIEAVLSRWGLPLGLLVDSDTGLLAELAPYTDALTRACLAARRVRSHGVDSRVREATTHLERVLAIGKSDRDKAGYASRVCRALPELLQIPLVSPREKFAEQRAAFRSLLTFGTTQALQSVAREVALQISSGVELQASAAEYIRVLLPHTQDVTALVELLRYDLAQDSSKHRGKITGLLSFLEKLDDDLCLQVLGELLREPEAFQAVMMLTRSRAALKSYILEHMPQSLLGEHLAGRDVDQVRSLLVGIHAKTLQKYVTAHRGKDRSRDAVDREVYDQHTHSYPEMLEDRIDIGLIPNYYKALGVPRTASPSEVKRSYRKLAFIYHEDRFGGESAASVERGRARLKQILEAYGVLGQRDERKAYNQRIGNDANSYPSEPWYMQLPTEDL